MKLERSVVKLVVIRGVSLWATIKLNFRELIRAESLILIIYENFHCFPNRRWFINVQT